MDLSPCYYFQAGTDKESDYAAICRPVQPYAWSPKSSTLAVTYMQKVVTSGEITLRFLPFSSDRLQGKCSPSVLCADLIMNGLFMWPLYLSQTVSVPAKQITARKQLHILPSVLKLVWDQFKNWTKICFPVGVGGGHSFSSQISNTKF